MSKKSTTTLKGYFNTADVPIETNFSDFIDSVSNLDSDCWDIDTTGFTDSTAKLQAIFDATADRETVFLPKGIILLSSTVVISNQINVVGQGTVIKTNTAIKMFNIDSDNVSIDRLHFERFSGTKDANQYGIFVNSKNKFNIKNCYFKNLYHGIGFESTIVVGSNVNSSITNCYFESSEYGIKGGVRGEYVNISLCRGYANENDIYTQGGNINITSCVLTQGTNGIVVASGTNDSHGIISGCEINHMSGKPLFFDGISKGMTVNAVHVFEGYIHLKDCSGVSFINCMLDFNELNFENALGSVFSHGRHLTGYSNTVNKSYNSAPASTVIANENYLLDGTSYTGL
jgi:hypothetical protein